MHVLRRIVAPVLVLAVLGARSAQAQDESVSDTVRPMLSIGLIGGGMTLRYQHDPSTPFQSGAPGIGFYARPGLRLSQWVDLEFEAGWATAVFLQNIWRVALTTGFTPLRWLSIAIGPVWAGFNSAGEASTYGNYLGGTLRIDLHPWANAKHRGVSFAIAGDLGKTLTAVDGGGSGSIATNGLGTGVFGTIGYGF